MEGFLRTTSHGFSLDSDAAMTRQTHEINADGRPQFAGRRGPADRKKYTAHGLVRRRRPLTSQTAFGGQLPYKGSLVCPAVRFHHSPFEYNGRLFTNHESRATNHESLFFSRAEGHSRRCRHSESVAAQRHLSPRRPAACGLRPAGRQAPITGCSSWVPGPGGASSTRG